ncbi:MAG: UvrD-helicase domain-containing protein [Treponema sp.]|nr:UvrD-helicase domain-containing protein [Treponema sp.]
MGAEKILAGLDPHQRLAVTSESNAVVSAGAGSGKTRVIASRYAWLVMEKGIPVEEILTLTFTNKAVNEMYSRIYSILASHRDNPRAREAAANFNRANILTLDSFCTGVARIAARRYGISPDFVCDPEAVRALAVESALPFALNNRDSQGLRALLGDKKIQTLAEELFADTVLSAGSIAAPLDFTALRETQRDEILRVWEGLSKDAAEKTTAMAAAMGALGKPEDYITELLRDSASFPPPPPIGPLLAGEEGGAAARKQLQKYFSLLARFCAVSFSGRLSPEKETIRDHRDALREIKGSLESAALFALSADTIQDVFSLLETYQREFNQKKREAGILTFQDIARLAVDALSRYPDLRQFYNRSFSAIMIDEFQDNNELQRELIFLLAEKAECDKPGIPDLPDLCPGKMIFVGDEKQSIYRFRGADVSVFRKLSDSFSRYYPQGHISLDYNYRSKPPLIGAFNYFFGGLSPQGSPQGTAGGPAVFLADAETLPDYEARYEGIKPGLGEGGPDDEKNPPLHVCFLDADSLPPDDPYKLSGADLEAAYIAMKIRELVDGTYQIENREKGAGEKRSCQYGDVAVLLRTRGHQLALEKQFQNFGIPYSTDEPAGLFSDAPVNDLYNMLRLLVYPQDKAAYAAVIRSPFCRFSDLALAACMLDGGAPFNEGLDQHIPEEERGAFQKTREQYRSLAEAARTNQAAELLTRLWYDEGYRHETLWSQAAQIYGELFDFIFELARQSDQRGLTLAEFLDDFARIIKNDERIRELRVPVEREGGVRIMTVHKSKGLEFPVVFVPGCQGKTRVDSNTGAVFFSDTWGLSLNLPPAEELAAGAQNYFYLLQRDDEKQKAAAELRRLLYVAMTRAESRLFLTAVLPPRNKGEREAREQEHGEPGASWIPRRLLELQAKKEESAALPGFLDLLLPVLTAGDSSRYTLETIPAYTRAELSRTFTAPRRARRSVSMTEAAEEAAAFYEGAPLVPPAPPPVPGVNASELRYTPPAADLSAGPEDSAAGAAAAETAPGDIDAMLTKAGLLPAEFGSIVHAYLEAPAPPGKRRIPPRFLARLDEKDISAVDAAARNMAERFLASELGRQSMADPRREQEFPILTMVEAGGKKIPVQGVIDLLFESAGVMQVVDFKTDKTEEPERHLAQLAVYCRAVSDIFGKPVRAWIFYLRAGNAREITAGIEHVDIEAMIAAHAPAPPRP